MDSLAHSPSLTFSERLADYVCHERLENVDAVAIAMVKQRIAYHVGLAFRGMRANEPDIMRALAVARDLSEGGGRCSVIGRRDKLNVLDAVFVNCQMMRAFGFDDVILKTGVHPGLVTIPVALTLSERHHASGAALITAIALGYEMMGKFAQWSWALEIPRRATMPFGPFGAIATAAKVLALTPPQVTVAMAYAAHTAMGVAEGDAGPISHYYGLVCRNSVVGAYLAQAGAYGSPTVLEGEFGFLETFLGGIEVDQDAMLSSLGCNYAILGSSEKRYPGTALNLVPIELMRGIMQTDGVSISDIESIKVALPIERRNFGGGHGKGPFTRATAPSSVGFQLGALLLDGDLRMSRYEDFDNQDILRIVKCIEFQFVEGKPIRYARLEVRTKSGRTVVREGDSFEFVSETPETILMRDANGVLPPAKISQFLDILDKLERVTDASALLECLVP